MTRLRYTKEGYPCHGIEMRLFTRITARPKDLGSRKSNIFREAHIVVQDDLIIPASVAKGAWRKFESCP
jgi:hypothetical protein